MDTNVLLENLLENTPIGVFIQNYIRDSSSVISIPSLGKISMISLISSLSLYFYLNSLCMIKTTSDLHRKSSDIFGNIRKFPEIFGKVFGKVRLTLEIFWKMFGNFRKVVGNLWKIVKNASSVRTLNSSSKI